MTTPPPITGDSGGFQIPTAETFAFRVLPVSVEEAAMSFPIRKSQFLAGLHCEKKLWLLIRYPENASPFSVATQQRFRREKSLEAAVADLFPERIQISGSIKDALEQSWEGMNVGHTINCFQNPAFIYDDILVRCDIVQRLPTGAWEIIELKSSVTLKQEHLADLALQLHVLRGLGLTIEKTSLMTVNGAVQNW